METWKNVPLSEEEEAGIVVEDAEAFEEGVFRRSLAGTLWSANPYNVRAFKHVITDSWRLKNPVEIQDLGKNLYLFRFSNKRDLENVLKGGPWSFDRNLLILKRVSGIEQPSEMDMHTSSFGARIYDFPLKLRSDYMARRLGEIMGNFEEADNKDANRFGKFLRIKVELDLRKPLKRGTVIRYQGKDLRVFFRYERLPNLCFACGRLGHQMKECEETEDQDEEGYEEIEEKDLPFGPWLRASPLPKFTLEQKRDSSSSAYSKSLFACTSSNKVETSEHRNEETEVEQTPKSNGKEKALPNDEGKNTEETSKEIEKVAETLGSFDLTPKDKSPGSGEKSSTGKQQKWNRQKSNKPKGSSSKGKAPKMLGKRQLIEVMITEGTPDAVKGKDRKRQYVAMEIEKPEPEVVLEDQHRLKP